MGLEAGMGIFQTNVHGARLDLLNTAECSRILFLLMNQAAYVPSACMADLPAFS